MNFAQINSFTKFYDKFDEFHENYQKLKMNFI